MSTQPNGLGHILGQLGLSLLQGGGQALGNAMQQQGNPQAFAQAQENQRQRQQLAQQLLMHNTITPYEQGELDVRKQEYANQLAWHDEATKANAAAHEEANRQWLATQLGEGNMEAGQSTDPGAMQIGGGWYKPVSRTQMKVPDQFQQLFGLPSSLPITKENQPLIDTLINFNKQKATPGKQPLNPQVTKGFLDQIDALYPTGPTQDSASPLAVNIPSGGVASRHNNPGNLKFAGQPNATQGEPAQDGGYWAKFDTPENGYQALKNQIGLNVGRGMTLAQHITQYAPPSSNNTQQYIQQIADALHVDPNTPLDKVDVDKLAQLQALKESGAQVQGGQPQVDPVNAKYNDLYKRQINSLAMAGDETGARTLMNTLTDEKRKEDSAVRTAQEKQHADEVQGQADAKAQFPDWKLENMWRQIKKGAVSFREAEQVFGLNDKYRKGRWADFLASKGEDFPIPLSSHAQTDLATKEPVLESLKLLKGEIAPLKDQKMPLAFINPRIKYAFGFGDAKGNMISTGEMDKLRGAAQSLAGLRTALPIFQQAQIHTPNFWIDSGKEANDKLDAMITYLDNNIKDIYKYGSKSGVVQNPDDDIKDLINRIGQIKPKGGK